MKRFWGITLSLCLAAGASWAVAQTGGGSTGSSSTGGSSAGASSSSLPGTGGTATGGARTTTGTTTGSTTTGTATNNNAPRPGTTGVSPVVGSTQPNPGGTGTTTGGNGPGSQSSTTGTINQPGAANTTGTNNILNPPLSNRLPGASSNTLPGLGTAASRPGNNVAPPPTIGGANPIPEPSLPPSPVGQSGALNGRGGTSPRPNVGGGPPREGPLGGAVGTGANDRFTQPRTGGNTPGGTLTPDAGSGNRAQPGIGNNRGLPPETRQPGSGTTSPRPAPRTGGSNERD